MTAILPPADLAAMEERAARATPGPWGTASGDIWCGERDWPGDPIWLNAPMFTPKTGCRRWGRQFTPEQREADAEFIAAANPQAVLALLRSHAALAAEVERLRAAAEPPQFAEVVAKHDACFHAMQLWFGASSYAEANDGKRQYDAAETDFRATLHALAATPTRIADLSRAGPYEAREAALKIAGEWSHMVSEHEMPVIVDRYTNYIQGVLPNHAGPYEAGLEAAAKVAAERAQQHGYSIDRWSYERDTGEKRRWVAEYQQRKNEALLVEEAILALAKPAAPAEETKK